MNHEPLFSCGAEAFLKGQKVTSCSARVLTTQVPAGPLFRKSGFPLTLCQNRLVLGRFALGEGKYFLEEAFSLPSIEA